MVAKDNTIKIGDMVVVSRGRPCCGNEKSKGYIFTVNTLIKINPPKKIICILCRGQLNGTFVAAKEYKGRCRAFEITQVTKIHPPPTIKTADINNENKLEKTI